MDGYKVLYPLEYFRCPRPPHSRFLHSDPKNREYYLAQNEPKFCRECEEKLIDGQLYDDAKKVSKALDRTKALSEITSDELYSNKVMSTIAKWKKQLGNRVYDLNLE